MVRQLGRNELIALQCPLVHHAAQQPVQRARPTKVPLRSVLVQADIVCDEPVMPIRPHVRAVDERVAEPEGGGRKLVRHGRVHVGIVVPIVPARLQLQVKQPADLLPEHQRQKLPVGDVLEQCADDAPRLLVHLLVAPVRVNVGEPRRDLVVLVHPYHVHHQQARLLAAPAVAGPYALIGKRRPKADVFVGWPAPKQQHAVAKDPCIVGRARIARVDGRCVQEGGGLVGLLAPG